MCSGRPPNFLRSSGSWVATPTGHLFWWQTRAITQPSASSTAVPKANSSAPSAAATTTSWPVRRSPSTRRRDVLAEARADQGAMHLGEAELPRHAGVLDGVQRGGGGAAAVAGDVDHVGAGLGHPGGDGADAGPGHQLHRDAGARIDHAQVVDELRQVLDGVDVVVRRRRDERDAGGGAAQPGDVRGDLVAGQLAALARLGALGDLDLELLGAGQVGRGDAEAPGGDLADLRGGPVAVLQPLQVREPAPRRPSAPTSSMVTSRSASSPPSPELARPWMRAMATAMVSCASRDSAPSDMPPVQKRGRIAATGSTPSAQPLAAPRRPAVRRRGRPVADQPQQVAQHRRRPLRELLAVAAVQVRQALHACATQRLGRLGVVQVVLAARPIPDEAVVLQLLDAELRERLLVDPHRLLGELLHAEAADARRRAQEPDLDEVGAEADGLEQLRAVVAGQQRDAHLGEDLEQALLGGDAVVAQGLLEVGGAGRRRFTGRAAAPAPSPAAGAPSPSRPRSQRSRTVSKARYGCTAEAP